jgi:hypothetical protein
VSDERYKHYLKATKEIVNLATNTPDTSVVSNDFSKFFSKKFNPPIVDLHSRVGKSIYGKDFPSDDMGGYLFMNSIFSGGLENIMDL